MRSWLVGPLFLAVSMLVAQPVSRVWLKTTSLPGNDDFTDLTTDAQGNYYACGVNGLSPDTGGILVKFDRNGTKLWERVLPMTGEGGIFFRSVAVDSSGNVFAAGMHKFTNMSRRSYLVKYSSSGAFLWERPGTATISSDFWDVAVDSAGEISTTGSINNGAGPTMRTSHYLPNGTWLWNRDYAYPNFPVQTQAGYYVAVDSTRNIYVGGYSYGTSSDIHTNIAKYSPSGSLMWLRHTNNSPRDILRDFNLTGTTCAVLSVSSAGSDDRLFITTFDENGAQASNVGGPISVGTASRINQTKFARLADGNFIACGRVDDPMNNTYLRAFQARFSGGTYSVSSPIGIFFGGGVAAGLTGGEFYYGVATFSSGATLISGVLPGYPSGNPGYSWQERLSGSSANAQTPNANMQILRVDNRGDLLVAGNLTGSQAYDAAIAKYELNPIALDDSYSTQVGQAINSSAPGLRQNDRQGSQATLALTQAPMNGSLTVFNEGSFSYSPTSGFAGVDRAYYKLMRTNGTAPYSSYAEVTFMVYPTITSFAFDPSMVQGGDPSVMKLKVGTRLTTSLTFPVTGNGVWLTGFYSSVTVPKESTVGEQIVFTSVVGATQTVTLTAHSGTSVRTATLTITP